jgi:hypothetical protein
MVKASIIKQYLLAGKKLTLLDGKRPKIKDWTKKAVSDEQLLAHDDNIGWVLGPYDLVVDVDPKNGGKESFLKLLEYLRVNDPFLKLEPTVTTPSGGFHVYLEMPDQYQGRQFKKTLNKEYPGIDFLTQGSQCVIPSSETDKGRYTWSDDMFGEFEQSSAPKSLIALIIYKNDIESELGDFDGLIGGESSNWPEDKVIDMLSKLDPSMPNDEWVKVGMALHDWDPVKGLELWENWSQGGDNYTEGDTDIRWKSFDLGGGVTLGTISHMAKLVVYDKKAEQVNAYMERIKFADEKSLEFDLLPEIRDQEFSKINREKIAKAVQDRFKDLSSIRMPIGNIRQMITKAEIVSGTFIGDGEIPEWCKDWIYVNSHAGFIDIKTLKLHKSESFNVENGKFVPMAEGGTKPSATKFVSDRGFVEKVDAIAYLPTYDGTICSIDGSSVLNSFNPKTVPIAARDFSDEGLAAIELVKKHIKFVCTTDEDADIFTQWLAHQVQYPGRQVLWSPVVQSIQGVGKSFFGELLRACLGDRNVGTVSPTQVTSDFNGWATNVVVNVLEELRVKGRNRFDAVNALKPLVTDRMIQINDKGVKQFMTYNTTNYMCFTNYKDSLPLDKDDRRWWVIFVPIQSLSELKQYVGEEAKTYFPKLFDAVRSHDREIRKWFLEYEITKEFLAIKQAPMTDDKMSMIATEEASFEGLAELKEMISTGGKYFNEDVVSSPDLFEALMFEHPEMEFKTSQRNAMLKRLGYVSLPQPVKIDGKSRRLWAKKAVEPKQARLLLLQKDTSIDDL